MHEDNMHASMLALDFAAVVPVYLRLAKSGTKYSYLPSVAMQVQSSIEAG
jgi:hypothetical protein